MERRRSVTVYNCVLSKSRATTENGGELAASERGTVERIRQPNWLNLATCFVKIDEMSSRVRIDERKDTHLNKYNDTIVIIMD